MRRTTVGMGIAAGVVAALVATELGAPASGDDRKDPTSDDVVVIGEKPGDSIGAIVRDALPRDGGSTSGGSLLILLIDPGTNTRAIVPAIREGLGKVLGELATRKTTPPSILVAKMRGPTEAPQIVLDATADAKRIDEAMLAVTGEAADPNYHDAFASSRAILSAPALDRFAGSVHLAIVSLDNPDLESGVDETAKALTDRGVRVHVLAPPTVYQDPYWLRPASRAPTDQPFALHGPESGIRQLPVGLAFQLMDPNGGVGSALGHWGLMRLAGATGGRYYLTNGPQTTTIDPFCKLITCPLCSGGHDLCDRPFNATVMRYGNSVDLRDRRALARAVEGDRLGRSILKTWAVIYELECSDSTPPGVEGGTSRANPAQPGVVAAGGARPFLFPVHYGDTLRLRTGLAVPLRNGPWSVWRKRAEKAIPELEAAAKSLRNAIKSHGKAARSRTLAAAEVTLALTYVTIFNCKQAAFLSDALNGVLDSVQLRSDARVFLKNVPFCHGAEAALEAEFLGEPAIKGDKKRLHALMSDLLERYRSSPWELVLRRAGLAYFEPRVVTPGPAIYRGPPRIRPRPRGPEATKPPAPPKPPRPPTRPTGPATGRTATGG